MFWKSEQVGEGSRKLEKVRESVKSKVRERQATSENV